MIRVEINPQLLVWARERAGLDTADLTRRFPKLPDFAATTEKES